MPFGVNDEVISQPKSFGQGDEVISPVSGFGVDDEVIKPANSVVLNKNTTGLAEPSQDTIAPLDSSLGAQFRRSSIGQAILGPGIQSPVGIKGVIPNLQQIYHGDVKPEVSKGYGVGNFNPSVALPEDNSYLGAINKGVLSQVSPENLSIIGALGKLHNTVGPVANVLKALSAAYFAHQGAESAGSALGTRLAGTSLTREEKGNLDFSAAMGGAMTLAPLGMAEPVSLLDKQNQIAARQVATGGIPEYLKPTPGRELTIEERNLRLRNQGPIFHSTPTVKEVPPNEIRANEQNSLPSSAVGSTLPEGGDNGIVARENATTISRGTPSPAEIGQQLGLKVQQWDPSIPVLGGSFSLTDPKTGMTVENLRPGISLEEVQQRMAEKNASPSIDAPALGNVGMKGGSEAGSVGLHVLDPEVWKELGFNAKTEGQQFINRLRNKLGGESAGWKMIDTPEFQQFMKSGPKTTQEVRDFVNSKGPKVKVMKFGQKVNTPALDEANQITHFLDTRGYRMHPDGTISRSGTSFTLDFDNPNTPKDVLEKATRFNELLPRVIVEKMSRQESGSHWQSIAPKSEQDMPGYTEIAVVKPIKKMSYEEYLKDIGKTKGDDVSKKYYEEKSQGSQLNKEQFPSSHSFPPNTLGFVRGYMETTPQGKKVFHVIEVQSDWAQQVRDKEIEYKHGKEIQSDPLLPLYERLAIKAAIDHAREQGADAIAISDAETAMMTEGHDRNPNMGEQYSPENLNEGQISQAPGMRLHYDLTLPKIAEELTGEKGTKKSFGEHRMVRQLYDNLGTGDQEGELRKNLIFRNESNEPKTDITARVYPITKAAKDFSIIGKDKPVKKVGNQGVSGESGMVDLSGARESLDKGIENLKEFFSDEGIRRKTMKMAGVSVPRTTASNESVGNQLTMFAQAEGVAEAKARSMASEVLGSHWKDKDFDAKLGAVGVEDQLRTKKAQLLAAGKTAEAQSVNTLVGQPYSPIKSEAQYQQLKNAPEIKAALARHIATVQGLAEQKQTALKGAIRSVGQDTGSFFNLIAKGVDSGEVHKARQGNTLATLKGGTRFGKEFKGTGAEYETSYRKMAERMVKGNWTEVEKQKLFDLVDSSGFGHLQKAGEDLPTFDKPMSPIPVQRRMAVIIKPGDKPVMKSQNETLWVPKNTEPEFRQAFQTDSTMKKNLLLNLVTKVQTMAGADAAIHVGNLGAAVLTSPEKATAFKYVIQNLAKTFETNPEVQKRLANMAEESGIVRQGEDEVAGWKKLIPGRNMISWVDQAGRLTFDQLYKDAIKRGESPDNPVWNRAAVQGVLGEYNKRLATKFQQNLKEWGISPFQTAGSVLNKLSLRQVVLSPSRKAVSLQGGAKMRLRQALYATGLIVAAPMVINTLVTGNPFPKGVQPGQFVIKKNEDGSYVVADVAKLFMWRRGLRNSGIQAVAKGIEDKQSVGQIALQAGKDIGRGIVHPFAGPPVSALDTALGGSYLADRPTKPFKGRVGDAIKQLNPTASMLLDDNPNKTGAEKVIGGVGRVVGLNITQNHVSRIKTLAHQWMDRNNAPMGDEPAGPYNELTNALRKNDAQTAREAIKKLTGKDRSDDVIKGYYDKIATNDFTDSKKHEKVFLSELSNEDKKVYQSVKDSNSQVRERFYNIFMGRPAPRLPREGREERPARENKFLPR